MPHPVKADAERVATARFSATPHIPASTTIRMDREAKKRFTDLVNDRATQASLRDPSNRVRIGPVRSSATEVRQRSGRSPETIERPEKDRYITVAGERDDITGKARAHHLFGYESP